MSNQVNSWNDDRLDELAQEMRHGFAKVKREMNEGFAEMRTAYAALNRTLLVGAMAIVAALIGVVGALVIS